MIPEQDDPAVLARRRPEPPDFGLFAVPPQIAVPSRVNPLSVPAYVPEPVLLQEAAPAAEAPGPSVLEAVDAAVEERPPEEDGATFSLFGTDLFGDDVRPAALPLAQRFIMPPFSVLDARSGPWQERKRAWVESGVRGELGREDGSAKAFPTDVMRGERVVGVTGEAHEAMVRERERERAAAANPDIRGGLMAEQWHGRDNRNRTAIPGGGTGANSAWQFKTEDGYRAGTESQVSGYGTSVFDPVLAELMLRWFCPKGGHVLDPFGGEATKGLVAASLGYRYTGVELRAEQVAVNNALAQRMAVAPEWVCGDSANLDAALPEGRLYDLVFTSPPYYNLEEYRGGEADGSTLQTYPQFLTWYREIFRQAAARLAPNRFLIVKVGEVRDKRTGAYYNFVGDNNRLFMELGLKYWNEFILITAIGSLPLRSGKIFDAARKCGKSHQNVHVYYGGEPRQIRHVLGTCDTTPESAGGEEATDG